MKRYKKNLQDWKIPLSIMQLKNQVKRPQKEQVDLKHMILSSEKAKTTAGKI
jgi:hypothetical protein